MRYHQKDFKGYTNKSKKAQEIEHLKSTKWVNTKGGKIEI